MITALAHVNILVPEGELEHAKEFYGKTLGLTEVPVPRAQEGTLAWFNITPDGSQQIHVAFGTNEENSRRHPCLRVGSLDGLKKLQEQICDHKKRGGPAAPKEADEPGKMNSGAQGVEYPTRFFARDFAYNRLEFTL